MFRNLFKMLLWKNEMDKHSRWFDKHEPAQARFEENEEWLEELEDRIVELENDSHPCKELHEFDAYPELIKRIEQLEAREEIGRTTAEKVNSEE